MFIEVFYIWIQRKKEGAFSMGLWERVNERQTGLYKNTTSNSFLVSKNPINVNQPGITVLFLFDMVWASLVKLVSVAP